jgi:pyrimidine-nucleoside phosphorylase
MHLPSLIERKRDGGRLERAEIEAVIRGFTDGSIPDYQMSALAMAILFREMDAEETASLTRAMMESGSVLRHPPGGSPKVDKHSTGGIGDKVSLVLAPLLASAGLHVPMISGRGLGITGGTLDKLESIPGFSTRLDEPAAMRQLARIGLILIGQTDSICPADRKLYALRDVTGTVPSKPLIVASILCKKLAESLDRLVLDVKFGSGAFMKTEPDAADLADRLRRTAEAMGVRTSCVLTPMHEPLGRSVGNALEVAEAVETLQGRGPDDLVTLTLDLCEEVCDAPREELARRLTDGSAFARWVEVVEAQGGDATALERLTEIHRAPVIREFPAPAEGLLTRLDAGAIGAACVRLGAGRARTTDAIDPAVGLDRIVKVGTRVGRGDPLFRVHARSEGALEQEWANLGRAIGIEEEPRRKSMPMNDPTHGRFLIAALLALLALTPRGNMGVAAELKGDPGLLDRLIPWILDERRELEGIPFPEVIRASTGHRVEPLEPDRDPDARVIREIGRALDTALARMNRDDAPVRGLGRINEASAAFENELRRLLDAAPGLRCAVPETGGGEALRSGYPDLRIEETGSGRVYYLDPKLYARGSRDATFRTFYFEPKRETNKVREDARHLLAGIEHDGAEGAWKFVRWDLVDLSKFRVRLKAEFQGATAISTATGTSSPRAGRPSERAGGGLRDPERFHAPPRRARTPALQPRSTGPRANAKRGACQTGPVCLG